MHIQSPWAAGDPLHPADWAPRATAEAMIYFLRSPGAANILLSAAVLYMLLQGCRNPDLAAFRDHMHRLGAGHGPTDEARENVLDLEAQVRLGTASTTSSARASTGHPPSLAATVLSFAIRWVCPTQSTPPGTRNFPFSRSLNGYIRLVATAVARIPAQLQPYPYLEASVSPAYRGDRLAMLNR